MTKIDSVSKIVLMIFFLVSAPMAAENVAAEAASSSKEKNENSQFPDVRVIEEKIDTLNEQIKLSEKAEDEATATRKEIPLENLSTQAESLQKKWRVLKDRIESQAVDEVPPQLKWEYEMSDIEKGLVEAALSLEKVKQKTMNWSSRSRKLGSRIFSKGSAG